MSTHQLAQVNIATALAPMDDPIMADFVALLDEINALAERTQGFVWRLKTDSGDATSIQAFDDQRIIINMSVWDSIEALRQFTYYSEHVKPYRRRGEWFERMDTPILVLWWVPVGHTPTTDEAKQRLAHLEQHGPTPIAFTFKKQFSVDEWLKYQSGVVKRETT